MRRDANLGADQNDSIRLAFENGPMEVVKLLLSDSRETVRG